MYNKKTAIKTTKNLFLNINMFSPTYPLKHTGKTQKTATLITIN